MSYLTDIYHATNFEAAHRAASAHAKEGREVQGVYG